MARRTQVLLAVFLTASWGCRTSTPDERGAELMLEMRAQCERCEAHLALDAEAFICSYECTFCGDCTRSMEHVCPNCQGELRPRPKRKDAGE